MSRLLERVIEFLIWSGGIALLMALPGCDRSSNHVSQETAVLPYKVNGANDKAIIKMQEAFNKQGIQVITLGQDYLIKVPSGALFADQSPRLRWGSYGLLNDIACYLRQFQKVTVHVSSYSNKCGSFERDRALTLARSSAVADYLWSQNIDSRFIFTHGLGSDKPIMKFEDGGDHSPNSRIEITFRNVVA